MKNTFGDNISLTIFGESHGHAIGAVLDGMAPGIPVDEAYIKEQLALRRPAGKISTQRVELDNFTIESGVYEGKTTGTPIAIVIPNTAQKSGDYKNISTLARPSHADYAAFMKYHGYEDRRGGGHFSGRITAAVVAAGAICRYALMQKGIYIGTHLKECAGICDRSFGDTKKDIKALQSMAFPVLDGDAAEKMQAAILKAREELDSVGGILETAVLGMPAGVGEPYFDSIESKLSHAIFSIGGVKGIEFGEGFGITKMRGSEANDPFRIEGGRVITTTNHSGGINGGITNGMPIVFRTAVKPTPSIYKTQQTIDFEKMENAEITIEGRHDPCIAHRVRSVVDAMTAVVVYDALR